VTHARLAAGARAELLAERYLTARGLRLITRNFRCRAGELDLVMEHGAELVIVEIRYRRHVTPVEPAASITRVKRDRIIRATANFIKVYDRYLERPLRFDVVALSGPLDRVKIQWLRAAFDCSRQTSWYASR
jgi:putative endonuclease